MTAPADSDKRRRFVSHVSRLLAYLENEERERQ
jgi:hypothetical protein